MCSIERQNSTLKIILKCDIFRITIFNIKSFEKTEYCHYYQLVTYKVITNLNLYKNIK
jgi:hypothetical protein